MTRTPSPIRAGLGALAAAGLLAPAGSDAARPALAQQRHDHGAQKPAVVVAIGKPVPMLRLAPGESARFGKGAEVSFDWGN